MQITQSAAAPSSALRATSKDPFRFLPPSPHASMTHPTLKITYFDLVGRAELTRLALCVAGIPFEDERLTRDQFAIIKPSLPFKQLPALTVGNEVFAQSLAMSRYAGRLAGLYPADALDAFRVDEILGASDDTLAKLGPSLREQDTAKRSAMRQELSATLPEHFACIEARLATHKGPYFLGDALTIADLELYASRQMIRSGWLDGIPTGILDAYPRWNAIADAVAAHPNVAAWEAAHKA
ncbi:glutathione S-transferase [Achlya hypogyna]|uniref:Glutathione S-transferase n=1 Tax=Achlya hypogyna TaxID=1202772 RepID=A0A1V9YBM9_ACHHY|nr:glutathione S-transferase [Achlya hypogyna]